MDDHDHHGDVRRGGGPRPPQGTTAAEDECPGERSPRRTNPAGTSATVDDHDRRGRRPPLRTEVRVTRARGNTGAGGPGRKETRAQGCGGARTGTGGREVWGSWTWARWGAAVRGRRDAAAWGRSAARRGTRGGEDGRTGARRRRAATPLLPCTMPLSHGTWGALARRRRHGELRLAAARRLAIDGGPVSCGRRRPRILPSLTLQHLGDGGGSTSRG